MRSGTPTHMAPEQWAGKRQGPNTDQYALATMFYELISGKVPFESALHVGLDAMNRCIRYDDVEPIDELTKKQWNALCIALNKSPEDRYPDCMKLMESLAFADYDD